MTLTALVLAGSRGGADPVALHAGVTHKALVEVGGIAMLARVVAALRAAGIDRIAVSTSAPRVVQLAEQLGTTVIPAAAGPSASVALAFERLGAPLLVTTADHALLDPAWIAQFLADIPAGADVAALLARQDSVERAVPETQRTYLRFADGGWSGCNLFYLATPSAANAVAFWQHVEADRKRPWRLVRRLGLAPLALYVTGRLTLADAVARLGRIAGFVAAVVAAADGLAAVDVDRPADLDLARRLDRAARGIGQS